MLFLYYLNFRAIILVNNVTKTTTDIELKGINIAAIIGDNSPLTAKYIPIILYRKDKTKLAFIILRVFFVRFKNLGKKTF